MAVLSSFTRQPDPRLLVGFEANDDAAAYAVSEQLAVVMTVDFFTPVVDDPYDFGRIAAVNALNDIYAMGAKPLLALNLLAISPGLGYDVAQDILRGGADTIAEAGALVGGGHTIDDEVPKYGLSVLGTVHPDKIIRNEGALPGDLLYLTKPLGSGMMISAVKKGKETFESISEVVKSMKELNAFASEAMIAARAHAATDVTGYGLAGHLHEMLVASGCSATLRWAQVPLFDMVAEYSEARSRPNLTSKTMAHAKKFVEQGRLDDPDFDTCLGVMCDPQTSGGLLIALAPDSQSIFEETYFSLTGKQAACIGIITPDSPGTIRFSS